MEKIYLTLMMLLLATLAAQAENYGIITIGDVSELIDQLLRN